MKSILVLSMLFLSVGLALTARRAALQEPVAKAPDSSAADAPAEKPVRQCVITTVDEQLIGAVIVAVDHGQLRLATNPPTSLPLADVERIEFGKLPPSGEIAWIGQDNYDLLQASASWGGNGIQDLHVRANTLKPLAIKQVVCECRAGVQLIAWRLDTSGSPHWRLAINRGELAPQAEFYFEPPALDCFGLTFEFNVVYADGSSTKMSTVATTHTDHQLKVNRNAQFAAAAQDPLANVATGAEVQLLDSTRLTGVPSRIASDELTLQLPWKGQWSIPLLRVAGIWFGLPAPAAARADYDRMLSAPGGDDVVLISSPDKTVVQLQAAVLGLADDRLNLRYDGADRAVKLDRVLGVVFAAHPKIAPPTNQYQIVIVPTLGSVSGQWLSIADDEVEIETVWKSRLRIPVDRVAEIRTRNGRVVSLADLEPASVEEVSFFGRTIPWRRDVGFEDAPPKVKGKSPGRSIAMHSRCRLSYDLDAQFERLKTTVGFDDSSQNRGRVACRVLVDGREAFAQPDLRADADPQALEIPLQGARQLTLEVDFGENDDIGDRVIWADPRLFRRQTN